MLHQQLQQVERLRRKVDLAASPPDLAAFGVELDGAEADTHSHSTIGELQSAIGESLAIDVKKIGDFAIGD